jgi:acyl-CoA synthetase (AMP-forming)/AMP-acid ligase II
MSLITRNLINKNLSVTGFSLVDNTFVRNLTNYNELIVSIDRAKDYLITECNCSPGQKVILCNFYWPSYLTWFFACAELGLPFVVSDYPKSESALKKLSLYGDIDYIVYDYHYPPAFDKFPEKLINSNVINERTVKETPIWATPDTILLLSTSSGTTGTPKVITHTHSFFADLLERNATLYSLKESDRCFHSKGLHHGSVTGVYFLPTIKYCANHYHAPYKFISDADNINEEILWKQWVDLFQEEHINKCLMFYDQTECLSNLLDLDKKTHNELTVFVLSKISPNWIENLVGKFGYNIQSIFGCTETSGPLFLPKITPENYKEYNPRNFSKVLDQYYKITLENSQLYVGMPDGSIVCTGDRFDLVNDEYIFKGRDDLYRINGRTIYLDFLNDILEEILDKKRETDFDIVFDQNVEKLYIRLTTNIDLFALNRSIADKIGSDYYAISNKVVAQRDQFFSGIKFDPEAIRFICRITNSNTDQV